MPKSKPLIEQSGEVRELTVADHRRMKPTKDVLSTGMLAKLGGRGPQKSPTKE